MKGSGVVISATDDLVSEFNTVCLACITVGFHVTVRDVQETSEESSDDAVDAEQ